MKIAELVTCIMLSTCLRLETTASTDTLKLLQILHRHGDRAPWYTFPNDPHKNFWTEGFGELTNLGKEQMYSLGLFIRQRYDGFLNASYNSRDVMVNSTSTYRTLQSAETLLAGLYEPFGNQIWNKNISWQPVPIFSTLLDIDYFINPDAICPKYDKLMAEFQQSEEWKEINNEYVSVYAMVSKETGLNITDLFSLAGIYDILRAQECHNLTWPTWVEPVWPQLQRSIQLKLQIQYQRPQQRRLRGGPLLGHMIDAMKKTIAGQLNQPRTYIYSSHDSMLQAFLSLLGVHNGQVPPFASAVFVELHQTADGLHTVQIVYKNTTGHAEPYLLTIPGCRQACPLEQLVDLTASQIPNDILEECEVTAEFFLEVLDTKRRFKRATTWN